MLSRYRSDHRNNQPSGGEIRTFDIFHQVLTPMSSTFVQFSSIITRASTTSPRLWGGIFRRHRDGNADAPLTNRLGIALGKTSGSRSDPSKLSMKSRYPYSTGAEYQWRPGLTWLRYTAWLRADRHPHCRSSLPSHQHIPLGEKSWAKRAIGLIKQPYRHAGGTYPAPHRRSWPISYCEEIGAQSMSNMA